MCLSWKQTTQNKQDRTDKWDWLAKLNVNSEEEQYIIGRLVFI